MAKVLVLTGSPHKKGNSNTMGDAFIEAAEKAGHEVTRFDTAQMNIAGCRGCMHCIGNGGECAISDDFDQLVPAFKEADVIVYVTPVYYYGYTAQLKAALDRTFRFAGDPASIEGKRVGLISCCEEKTDDTFTGLRFMFERGARICKQEIIGEVCVPGVFEPGAIEATDGIARAAAFAAAI